MFGEAKLHRIADAAQNGAQKQINYEYRINEI